MRTGRAQVLDDHVLVRFLHQRERPDLEPFALGERCRKAGVGEHRAKRAASKAGIMRHERHAAPDGIAVAEQHVMRRDRTHGRGVGDIIGPVLEQQRGHRLEIGRGDERKACRLQNSPEFGERRDHFMRMQMLEAVRSPKRVEGLGGNERAHVGHRAEEVGLDLRIDIEAHFLPAAMEHRMQPAAGDRAGARIENALRCGAAARLFRTEAWADRMRRFVRVPLAEIKNGPPRIHRRAVARSHRGY